MPTDDERDEGLDDQEEAYPSVTMPLLGEEDVRFARLKSLNFFQKIHEMILGGWPPNEVAKYIQKNKKEMLDLTEDHIIKMVSSYKRSLPDFERITHLYIDDARKALDRVKEGLDEVDEIRKLYMLQMKRISIDFETEKVVGKLLPTMSTEIRMAKDLLMSSAQLKMDLGLDSASAQKLSVVTGDPADAMRYQGATNPLLAVVQNPETRQKLLSALTKLKKLQVAPSREEVEAEESKS